MNNYYLPFKKRIGVSYVNPLSPSVDEINLMVPHWKIMSAVGLSSIFKKTRIPFMQDCFVSRVVETDLMFLEKNISIKCLHTDDGG